MGSFDIFKKKKQNDNEPQDADLLESSGEAADNFSVNTTDSEQDASSADSVGSVSDGSDDSGTTESEERRPSLLERLQGAEPIFTDHESDIQFQEEYEQQQKELASYKLREGLKKTKDGFVSKVEQLLNSFTKIDEDFFDELEETLILSDIGAQTSMEICDRLRSEVKKTGTTEPSEVKQMLKNIISEMLSGGCELDISTKPSVIMVIGVNGAGKTTTIGKMAANFKNSGKKVIVAAADTFRAAAIDQLNVWTDRAGVDIVKHSEGADPAAVVFDAISAAKARGADIVLCDTAGRLHNKKNLMEELKKIARVISRELPDAAVETLLVLDATTGQNAVNQAKLFNESADITGIVLTKLDGTAKGGIIIPIKNELGLSVKLVGVGEKIDDLQPFNAEDYVEALFE